MKITLEVGVQYTASGILPTIQATDDGGQRYSITPDFGGNFTVRSELHGDDRPQDMTDVPFDVAWRGLAVSFGVIEP